MKVSAGVERCGMSEGSYLVGLLVFGVDEIVFGGTGTSAQVGVGVTLGNL